MKQRLALKHPTGWFAAGREMEQALGLLSDGAFKLYVYLCLHAQRSSGRLRFRHSELAQSLGKSPRSITSYLKELQCQGACHVEAAANQHHVGSIEIADHFWPYRKPPFETPLSDETRYIEQVRQLFLSRACVQETFQRGRREACCGAVSASRTAGVDRARLSTRLRPQVRRAAQPSRCGTHLQPALLHHAAP